MFQNLNPQVFFRHILFDTHLQKGLLKKSRRVRACSSDTFSQTSRIVRYP